MVYIGLVFKIVYECVLCPGNMPELASNKVRKGLSSLLIYPTDAQLDCSKRMSKFTLN